MRKSQVMFCVRVRPWLHSDNHKFFLDPDNIRKQNIVANGKFAKGTALL